MPMLALELIPLAIASALLPLPLIVMLLLLRGRSGRAAALGWVAGQATVRAGQGVVILLLLDRAAVRADEGEPGPVVSAVLVVLAVLFYALAARKALKAPDDDAPPPQWLDRLDGATTGQAFLLGSALLAINVKFWVLTLGAAGAIADARLDLAGVVIAYLGFVVVALAPQLALLAATAAAPAQADRLLARLSALLDRYSRHILITVGLLFGTIFLLEGLAGLGLL